MSQHEQHMRQQVSGMMNNMLQQQQQRQRVLNGPPSYGKDYLCTSVALRHLVKAAILVETDGDESGCDDEIIVLVSLQA